MWAMHSDNNCKVSTDLMHYAITIVGILTQLLFGKWSYFIVLSAFFFWNVKGNKSILSMLPDIFFLKIQDIRIPSVNTIFSPNNINTWWHEMFSENKNIMKGRRYFSCITRQFYFMDICLSVLISEFKF